MLLIEKLYQIKNDVCEGSLNVGKCHKKCEQEEYLHIAI